MVSGERGLGKNATKPRYVYNVSTSPDFSPVDTYKFEKQVEGLK